MDSTPLVSRIRLQDVKDSIVNRRQSRYIVPTNPREPDKQGSKQVGAWEGTYVVSGYVDRHIGKVGGKVGRWVGVYIGT